MRRCALRCLALLLGGSCLAGCADGTGSDTLRGSYVLTSVNGSGPPLIVTDYTDGGGSRSFQRFGYDSLTFTSDSTIQRSYAVEATWYRPDGPPLGPVQGGGSYPGYFVRRGSSLVVRWHSVVDPSQNRTDTLQVREGALIRQGYVWFGSPSIEAVRRAPFEYTR